MPWPGTNEPSTTKDLAVYIGQVVNLRADELWFDVRILDVRSSFGNVHFLVTPMEGTGEQWVGATRCSGYVPALR